MSNNIPLNLGYRKPAAGPSLFTISFQPLTFYRGPTTLYAQLQPAEITIEQFTLLPEGILVYSLTSSPRVPPPHTLSFPRPSKGYLPAGEKAFSGYLS